MARLFMPGRWVPHGRVLARLFFSVCLFLAQGSPELFGADVGLVTLNRLTGPTVRSERLCSFLLEEFMAGRNHFLLSQWEQLDLGEHGADREAWTTYLVQHVPGRDPVTPISSGLTELEGGLDTVSNRRKVGTWLQVIAEQYRPVPGSFEQALVDFGVEARGIPRVVAELIVARSFRFSAVPGGIYRVGAPHSDANAGLNLWRWDRGGVNGWIRLDAFEFQSVPLTLGLDLILTGKTYRDRLAARNATPAGPYEEGEGGVARRLQNSVQAAEFSFSGEDYPYDENGVEFDLLKPAGHLSYEDVRGLVEVLNERYLMWAKGKGPRESIDIVFDLPDVWQAEVALRGAPPLESHGSIPSLRRASNAAFLSWLERQFSAANSSLEGLQGVSRSLRDLGVAPYSRYFWGDIEVGFLELYSSFRYADGTLARGALEGVDYRWPHFMGVYGVIGGGRFWTKSSRSILNVYESGRASTGENPLYIQSLDGEAAIEGDLALMGTGVDEVDLRAFSPGNKEFRARTERYASYGLRLVRRRR